MDVVDLKLSELTLDPDNPRTNDGAVEKVAESIRQFGFNQPIVVNKERMILAGHTRYLAAALLKLKTVPCFVADKLTPAQQRAYNIADNRAGDFSFFDLGKLGELMDELDEQFISDFDLESLLSDLDDGQSTPELPEAAAPEKREGLDLAPFEKYQYVTVICRTTYDYTNLLERLGLEDLQARYVGPYLKRGQSIGRIIEYAEFLRQIDR